MDTITFPDTGTTGIPEAALDLHQRLRGKVETVAKAPLSGDCRARQLRTAQRRARRLDDAKRGLVRDLGLEAPAGDRRGGRRRRRRVSMRYAALAGAVAGAADGASV